MQLVKLQGKDSDKIKSAKIIVSFGVLLVIFSLFALLPIYISIGFLAISLTLVILISIIWAIWYLCHDATKLEDKTYNKGKK